MRDRQNNPVGNTKASLRISSSPPANGTCAGLPLYRHHNDGMGGALVTDTHLAVRVATSRSRVDSKVGIGVIGCYRIEAFAMRAKRHPLAACAQPPDRGEIRDEVRLLADMRLKHGPPASQRVAVRMRSGQIGIIRLSKPPQLQPILKSRMLSSIAAIRSLATGCNAMLKSPLAPLKSRFHSACPREPGNAG